MQIGRSRLPVVSTCIETGLSKVVCRRRTSSVFFDRFFFPVITDRYCLPWGNISFETWTLRWKSLSSLGHTYGNGKDCVYSWKLLPLWKGNAKHCKWKSGIRDDLYANLKWDRVRTGREFWSIYPWPQGFYQGTPVFLPDQNLNSGLRSQPSTFRCGVAFFPRTWTHRTAAPKIVFARSCRAQTFAAFQALVAREGD